MDWTPAFAGVTDLIRPSLMNCPHQQTTLVVANKGRWKMGNRFMQPAIKLMGALNYRVKFLLIFLIFSVPLGSLSLQTLSDLRDRTEIVHQEKTGVEYIEKLNPILRKITDHRGKMNGFLRGNVSSRGDIIDIQTELDKAFTALETQNKLLGKQLKINNLSSELQSHWNTLKKDGFNISANESFKRHTKIVTEINELIRHVAITSSLILDPEIESHFLATIAVERLPSLIEGVARLRGLSSGAATQKMLSLEDRMMVSSKKESVLENIEALEFELRVAYQQNDKLQAQLKSADTNAVASARNYAQHIEANMLNSNIISATADTFFEQGSNALDKVWALNAAIVPAMQSVFDVRLAKYRQQEWLAYGVTNLVLLFMIYIFAGFYLGVRRTIAQIDEGARDIAAGNLSRRVTLDAKDEMVQIAASFNTMAEELEEKTKRERQQMDGLRKAAEIRDKGVAVLRQHIEQVAAGDLTRRVELTGGDDLAQLGRELNAMTASLAGIANETTQAINVINSTLEELQSSINTQSAGASEQAASVNETTSSLEEIKAMSGQTLEKVRILGETAERSRRESEQGTEAVDQSIVGMNSIRERVEGIAHTILALSEQTQQIGEITAVVTNLAQQSKMLALNASIEAAKAGEAGKGFAVVAAEVRELAEQSQQSTAQVQKILQDIRHATDRAVMATEEGSKGVDIGVISVQRSGEAMRQLGEVIRETALASQQIAAAVRQESIGIDQVTLAMNEISKITSQFVSSSQQSKIASADLSKVAEHLRDSVRVYKL
jgi:methyl-accepting chemotaxis protein